MTMAHPTFESMGWRWLKAKVWGLEHAFERAKAAGKAEDDTRIRIFFVLALFATAFLLLAVGATRAALFSDAGRSGGYAAPVGALSRPRHCHGFTVAHHSPPCPKRAHLAQSFLLYAIFNEPQIYPGSFSTSLSRMCLSVSRPAQCFI